MRTFNEQAKSLRRRVLQPAADLAVVHMRADPFLIGAILVWASIGMDVADDVYSIFAGKWSAWIPVFEVPWTSFKVWVASGMLRFRGNCDVTHFRVVHPVFRSLEAWLYANVFFGLVMIVVTVVPLLASHPSVWDVVWRLTAQAAGIVGNVGALFAACEWRRLPPAPKREVAPSCSLSSGLA